MSRRAPTGVVGALALASTAAAASLAGLDPPSGPLTETAPSLADLENGIDAGVGEVLTAIAMLGPGAGPTDLGLFRAPATGELDDQFVTTLVAPGRVYVESVTAFQAFVTLFDGEGEITNGGRTLTTNWIARNSAAGIGSTGSGGLAYITTERVPVRRVVEDGLYAAWDSNGQNAGFVLIEYRTLEEQP